MSGGRGDRSAPTQHMYVGVLRLTLRIPSARSLKDRRKIVRSLKDRVQSKLRASVAEVGGLDEYRRAVIGVAVVAADAVRVDELLSAAASMAGGLRDAVLIDRASEVIPFGAEGASLESEDLPHVDFSPEDAWLGDGS